MEFTRTVVAGSVGMVGWFVPLLLVLSAGATCATPSTTVRPAGR